MEMYSLPRFPSFTFFVLVYTIYGGSVDVQNFIQNVTRSFLNGLLSITLTRYVDCYWPSLSLSLLSEI